MDVVTLALAKAYTNEVALGEGAIQGPAGPQGPSGRQIELQTTADYIQWRYAGDETWTNLIPLSELKGADGAGGLTGSNGETPQFRMSGNTLQYRFATQNPTEWTNLYTFTDGPGGVANISTADLRVTNESTESMEETASSQAEINEQNASHIKALESEQGNLISAMNMTDEAIWGKAESETDAGDGMQGILNGPNGPGMLTDVQESVQSESDTRQQQFDSLNQQMQTINKDYFGDPNGAAQPEILGFRQTTNDQIEALWNAENTLETKVNTVKGRIDNLDAQIETKQGILTFDNTPTLGSSNPVTSDGIKTAIANVVTEQAFPWYTFTYGQIETGNPAMPSEVNPVAGEWLYNFTDGLAYEFDGSDWTDKTTELTADLLNGSYSNIGLMVDGNYAGNPVVARFESDGETDEWFFYLTSLPLDNESLILDEAGRASVNPAWLDGIINSAIDKSIGSFLGGAS